MWFDPGLTGLFITSTLLHLGEDIFWSCQVFGFPGISVFACGLRDHVITRFTSLCHTPIKPDLLGFPGIGVFACGLRDHVITRFASEPQKA